MRLHRSFFYLMISCLTTRQPMRIICVNHFLFGEALTTWLDNVKWYSAHANSKTQISMYICVVLSVSHCTSVESAHTKWTYNNAKTFATWKYNLHTVITLCIGTDSLDPDQLPQNASFDQSLHCLPYIQQYFRHINWYSEPSLQRQYLFPKMNLLL